MSAANHACFISRAKEWHIGGLCHTGMLSSPGVSSESSIAASVESDFEATLALGTSNSNDELECFRPRRTVVHDDMTPCVAVKI